MFEPITFDEYEAAYKRFMACMRDSGVGHTDHGLVDLTFSYTTEADDDFEAAHPGTIKSDACYEREFRDADERWQFTVDSLRDRVAFERALVCLRVRGVADLPEALVAASDTYGLLEYGVSQVGLDVWDDFMAGKCP